MVRVELLSAGQGRDSSQSLPQSALLPAERNPALPRPRAGFLVCRFHPKEGPDEKVPSGPRLGNLNAGVRCQPYRITMSWRSLLWHVEHLPSMK